MAGDARRIDAVTFDFWNTLIAEDVDPWKWKTDSFLAAAVDAGHPVDRSQMRQALDEGKRFYQRAWEEGEVFTPEQWSEVVGRELGVSQDTHLMAVFASIIHEGLPAERREVTPGTAEVLPALAAAGIRIGIICDVGLTPSTRLRSYLEHFGLLQYFNHWSFSDEVGVYKPDLRIFEHASAGLEVPLNRILHTGDLRRTDITGGQAAGMVTARYRGASDDLSDGPEGDHVTSDHTELLAILGL